MSEGEQVKGRQKPKKFQGSFYSALVISWTLVTGFFGHSTVSSPYTCGVAFVLSLIGWLKGRSVLARMIGVILTGVFGGYLLQWARVLASY